VAGDWKTLARFTTYYWGDQIKEDERGEACSMDGKDEKCTQVLEK